MTDSAHEDTGAHVVKSDLDYIQLQTNLETNSIKHFHNWKVTFYPKPYCALSNNPLNVLT